MDCMEEGFLVSFSFDLASRDCNAKGYDEDHLLENDESREYHIERHNHYMELVSNYGGNTLCL